MTTDKKLDKDQIEYLLKETESSLKFYKEHLQKFVDDNAQFHSESTAQFLIDSDVRKIKFHEGIKEYLEGLL